MKEVNQRTIPVQLIFFGLSLVVFVYVFLINAWVVDDAYITFRTVDNFLHGYGLRWNVDERVQVYTHPLWMLVMVVGSFITSDVFFTSIALSFFCSLGAILIVVVTMTQRFRVHTWKATLLVIALCCSKAFIDYTSSGLENSLSYLTVALFFAALLSFNKALPQINRRDFTLLFFFAALAFVNRMDTLLLCLPALIYAGIAARTLRPRELLRHILLGTLPATLWVLFSVVYYGFPLPNTAYAKMISYGFPVTWRLSRGLEYLSNSVSWDPYSYLLLLLPVFLWVKKRDAVTACLLGGIVLYLLYVLFYAASATHMSGRFFALPFFVAFVLAISQLNNPRVALVLTTFSIVYVVWNPISSIKFGGPTYQIYAQDSNRIDAKWYVAQQGGALVDWAPGRTLPDHQWYHDGERVRNTPGKVHVGGSFGSFRNAIGYFGYAAGPQKFIIDIVGLGDPLLGRLPAVRPNDPTKWKSGHFLRAIPDGYLESVERDTNVVRQEGIHEYYDKIRIITRGNIFSWERFKTIWRMNVGAYDYLISQRS